MKTVKMHGPALSGKPRMVNRDVPACDVQAYKAAGYVEGSIPEPEVVEDAPKAEPKPKARAKK